MRLLVLIVVLEVAWMKAKAGDTECTRACTMDDKTSTCWRQSVRFYTEQLETAIQEYVGTLTHVSRWNSLNDKTPDYKAMANAAIAGALGAAQREKRLEPLGADEMLAIFELILNKTTTVEEHYNDPEVSPVSFSCPIPCDYYPSMWMTLFFVALSSLLLVCIAFCAYLAQQQIRMEQTKHR